jgi:hypothetical protein
MSLIERLVREQHDPDWADVEVSITEYWVDEDVIRTFSTTTSVCAEHLTHEEIAAQAVVSLEQEICLNPEQPTGDVVRMTTSTTINSTTNNKEK